MENNRNPVDEAVKAFVQCFDLITRSGKNVIPNTNVAVNIHHNISLVIEFLSNVVNNKENQVLPAKVLEIFDSLTMFLSNGFTAGVFGLSETVAMHNSVAFIKNIITSEVNKHVAKEKEEHEKRVANAQKKLEALSVGADNKKTEVESVGVKEVSEDNV